MKKSLKPQALARIGCRKFWTLASILALFCFLTRCEGQGTLTFTFNGQPPGSYTWPVGSYSEAGAQFAGPHGEGLALVGSSLSGAPDNGTGYLQVPAGAQLTFSLTPFAHFNFVSFDAAELSTSFPGPVTLQVIGYHVMSVTVTNFFTTDGINDSTGPLQDFQTFFLDTQFQDIYRVDILTERFSLDNVVISGVPEPTTGALMVLGTLAAFGWKWGRRRRQSRD